MRGWKKLGLALLGTLLALAAVLAWRTATLRAPASADLAQVELAEAPPMDNARAARHLAEAVRIRTVSHQDPAENDSAQWDALHAWLIETYPAAHRAMTREIVAGHTLV